MNQKLITAGCLFTNYCAERHNKKMDLEFWYCKHCGKVLILLKDTQVGTVCCGNFMEKLIPASIDAEIEKHVPVIFQNGREVVVKVGQNEHPMTKEHYIEWIILVTDKGIQQKYLCPGDKPNAEFIVTEGESIQGAYAFCNLHWLWKSN
ncbi:MAG: desulfoferrodoxin [Treponema sp.]|nr:desulfoferrodoxin [Treponema sp.]